MTRFWRELCSNAALDREWPSATLAIAIGWAALGLMYLLTL